MKNIFVFTNSSGSPIEFILEPWAHEYLILPRQEIKIIGLYENENPMCEIEISKDGLVFFAWDHSSVQVFIDDEDKTLSSNTVIF